MEKMRLQKFLSAAGVCSRRKGEELISEGAISVNGAVVVTPGTKIDPLHDTVMVRGQRISFKQDHVYIVLNKPVDVECTCRKRKGHETIILDLVDISQRIYPVGRLDKDSEGLILLTSDGRIHHALSHPSFEHEKEYQVTVKSVISDNDLKTMASGMTLETYSTRPCRIKRLSPQSFSIILKEGKNRQIRRMAEAVGHDVRILKRVRIAHIRIGDLKTGTWRHLTKDELTKLMKMPGLQTNSKNHMPSEKYSDRPL